MTIYRGEISFVLSSRGYLFIKKDSIHEAKTGKPYDPPLGKDLFCHVNENPDLKIKRLAPGQMLTFTIGPDKQHRRDPRLVACNATPESFAPAPS